MGGQRTPHPAGQQQPCRPHANPGVKREKGGCAQTPRDKPQMGVGSCPSRCGQIASAFLREQGGFFQPRKHRRNYVKPCECSWLSPHPGDSRHSPSGLIGQHHGDTLMQPCFPNTGIPLSHREKATQRRAIHPREPHPEAAPRQQPPPYISAMPECSGGVTAGGLFTISSPTPALTSHQTLPARPTGQPTKGQLGRAGGGGGRDGSGATSRHRLGLPRRGNQNSAR